MASIGAAAATSPTLTTDQVAAKQAQAASTKASAQLTADQRAKAAADAIKNDQVKVKDTEAAQKQADAKVLADQSVSLSGGVNITA